MEKGNNDKPTIMDVEFPEKEYGDGAVVNNEKGEEEELADMEIPETALEQEKDKNKNFDQSFKSKKKENSDGPTDAEIEAALDEELEQDLKKKTEEQNKAMIKGIGRAFIYTTKGKERENIGFGTKRLINKLINLIERNLTDDQKSYIKDLILEEISKNINEYNETEKKVLLVELLKL